jgi:hypothetical protein
VIEVSPAIELECSLESNNAGHVTRRNGGVELLKCSIQISYLRKDNLQRLDSSLVTIVNIELGNIRMCCDASSDATPWSRPKSQLLKEKAKRGK